MAHLPSTSQSTVHHIYTAVRIYFLNMNVRKLLYILLRAVHREQTEQVNNIIYYIYFIYLDQNIVTVVMHTYIEGNLKPTRKKLVDTVKITRSF